MKLETRMKWQIVENYDALSLACKEIVEETIRKKPNAVLCMPTGSTPLGLYNLLAEQSERSLWNQVRIVCLDDYFGIAKDDERSFFHWQRTAYIDPLGIAHDRVYRIDPSAADARQACQAFEQQIAGLGGIDLTLLGLGLNGHIGFNEPGTSVDSRTHAVKLTDETIRSNAAYWGGDPSRVPQNGITLGIGTILESERILVMVSGDKKAEILRAVLTGPETAEIPASYLHRAQHALVIADKSAAKLL